VARFRILILGLGQVAIGYDITNPGKQIKSHLFAIEEYGRLEKVQFEISAVDPDLTRIKRAKKYFPLISYFSDLSEIEDRSFDIILNAVPIRNLFDVTNQVLQKFEYKYFFIEKPGVATISQALQFNEIVKIKRGIFIIYPRRVLKSTAFLKKLLALDGFGNWNIEIQYSGTLANILSHFLDLLDEVIPIEYKARFHGLNNISISQTSISNNNDHKLVFEGPHQIVYEMGGMFVSDTRGNMMDFSAEIESQIWFTANSYLNFARGLEMPKFPAEISQLAMNALEVRDE